MAVLSAHFGFRKVQPFFGRVDNAPAGRCAFFAGEARGAFCFPRRRDMKRTGVRRERRTLGTEQDLKGEAAG